MADHPILVSYAYVRTMKDADLLAMFCHPNIDWLIDSGGFSALNAGFEIKLEDYCNWLNKWKPYLFGYIALDKVGDKTQTDINLRLMQQVGLRPIPVHVWGDDERRMDELFEMSDWVALGGLRRPHSVHSPKSYVKRKHEWAKGRRVHWLGYTHAGMVKALRPFSCDSSNNVSGYSFGRMMIYHGDCATWTEHGKLGNTRDIPFTPGEVRWINHCGFHVAEMQNPSARNRFKETPEQKAARKARETGSRRHPLGIVTMNSHVRYSRDMLKKYGVRVFNAIGATNYMQLIECIDYEDAKARPTT